MIGLSTGSGFHYYELQLKAHLLSQNAGTKTFDVVITDPCSAFTFVQPIPIDKIYYVTNPGETYEVDPFTAGSCPIKYEVELAK